MSEAPRKINQIGGKKLEDGFFKETQKIVEMGFLINNEKLVKNDCQIENGFRSRQVYHARNPNKKKL